MRYFSSLVSGFRALPHGFRKDFNGQLTDSVGGQCVEIWGFSGPERRRGENVLGYGTVTYHLLKLNKDDKIISFKNGRFSGYILSETEINYPKMK